MADRAEDTSEIDPVIIREYEAYLAQPDDWKEANRGKFVVFKDGKPVGVFDTSADALRHAVDTFGLDRFLVHQVGDEDTPHTFTQAMLGCI